MFRLFDSQEKRILAVICFLLGLALVFLVFISLGKRRDYFRTAESLKEAERNYQQLVSARDEDERKWLAWEEALRDMDELKKTHFFSSAEGMKELRLGLQKLFVEAGISVSQLNYEYADLLEGMFRKVRVSFVMKGSYFSLKKFLSAVEMLPKFLAVERVDFFDVGSQGNLLELKIHLAGYYAN